MNNSWDRRQLVVADFIQRSRNHSINKSQAVYLRPNFILGLITVLILFVLLNFLVTNLPGSDRLISTNSLLNEFFPRNFSFAKNIPVNGRYSNQYIRSASAIYTFVYEKVLDAKLEPAEAQILSAAIVDAGQRTGLDPLLIASIVKAESAFKVKATSPVGAAGLMQLMPATAKYIGKKVGMEPRSKSEIYDPKLNLILGSAYFIYLNKMFHGNLQRSLVAYNWGPANAELAYYKGQRSIPTVTQLYTRQVVATHRIWKAEFAEKQVELN